MDSTIICAICLAPYSKRIYLSPCFHSFCAECIATWLDVTLNCPLCKTAPTKIHWGVDTSLGILNTIVLSSNSGEGSQQSHKPNGKKCSWKEALKEVILSDKSPCGDQNNNPALDDSDTDINSTSLSNSSKRNLNIAEEDHQVKRLRQRSRSRSRTRSRSRSTTPIDSYHHLYGSSSPNIQSSSLSPEHIHDGAQEALQPNSLLPTHTRREIYALGMEPYPAIEYPLADRVLLSDMTALRPFLQRDLAVLTGTSPGSIDPIVLAHVSSLFTNFGGGNIGSSKKSSLSDKLEAQWDLIEREVSQWVTVSPSESMTEMSMAQLFVKEMRRVIKKRWKVDQWDSNVTYGVTESS